MSATEQDTGEWGPSGAPVRGVRGVLLALVALAYHFVSLRWLRAPRWQDKGEARLELRRLVSQRETLPYAYWTARIGETERLAFTTIRGTWYQATVEPVWDDQPGGAVRVLFALDDGGVGAFHPLTESLLIEKADRGA